MPPARLSLRLVFAALLLSAARIAGAHAVLLDSSPAADAVVDAPPTEIRLGFNENVGPIFVRVLAVDGTEVGGAGELRVAGNDVFLPLGNAPADGTYVVTYRVISADTHPVGGSFVFAIGGPIADAGAIADAGSAVSAWRYPVAVNRFVLYAAGALAVGSALLLLLVPLPSGAAAIARRQGRTSAVAMLAALVLAIGLGGAEMLAGGATAPLAWGTWSMGLGSTLGSSALIGVPGAVLLLVAFRRDTPATAMLLSGAALLTGSFLVTGHAATAPPAWLMALVVGIHLVGVAFWFAALLPLLRGIAELDARPAAELLARFSSRATWAVAALVASGVAISAVQVRSFEAMFTTDYGSRLALKLGLVAVVLVLAALNRLRLTGRVAAGDSSGRESLKRSIRLEFALMLGILAAAVSLTLPSPPRAIVASVQAAQTGGFVTTATRDDVTASIEVTPATPGPNMLMLTFTDAAGAPLEIARARVTFSLPAASLDGVEHEGERVAPGVYHFMLNELIIPGDWQLRIDAFVDDFDKRILRADVPIGTRR